MRNLKKSWLVQALAPAIMWVLVFGPLGICCHEHEHGEDRAHQATHRVCVGICACHFSVTPTQETTLGAQPEPAFTPRPRNDRHPGSFYFPGIDHPPENIA